MRKNVLIVALVLLVALVSCAEHEHAWNAGVVVKKSTCIAEGEKVYTCEGCGAEMSEILPVDYDNGHSFVDGVCTECKQEEALITTAVARVGSTYYDTLDGLFEKEKGEIIEVVLLDDAKISIAPWNEESGNRYVIGSEETKKISISGNDKTISFDRTNSDWNNVITANENTVLEISNASIVGVGHGSNTGTWNTHDIYFNCNVILKNVVSKTAIAVGMNANFEKVSISDKDVPSDTYMLWVVANGQVVKLSDCEIDGKNSSEKLSNRAIAIKDQYVESPASVTLSVKDTIISSDKKAAILVTSTEGANIELENVDIEGTPDKVNAVWIDNGSNYGVKIKDKVIVKGGSAIIEGN